MGYLMGGMNMGENMKYIGRGFLLLACIFSFSSVAMATKSWNDEAELSFVDTGGNTEVTTLAAKNLLKVPIAEKITGSWKLHALYGKSDGVKNAESYSTELRVDYAQTDRLFYFVSAGWLQDKFSGIENRYVYGVGSGYKILDGPKHFLVGEIGLTYTTEDYTDDSSADYLGGRLFGQYDYKFNEANKFVQSIEFLPEFDDTKNWLLNSETALIAAMSSHFSMKTGLTLKYDNQPTPGLDKTDRIVSVALVANF